MKALGLPLLLAVASLCGGCLSTLPIDMGSDSGGGQQSLGSIVLVSNRLGNETIVPSTCAAGDRQSFLGGDFADEKSGFIVRLVVDPLEGPAARVFSSATPYDKTAVFHRSDCRTFHFSLDSTNWRINDVQDYRISLTLDCSDKDGDTISGNVSATHCH
jgi:hypothetical protein